MRTSFPDIQPLFLRSFLPIFSLGAVGVESGRAAHLFLEARRVHPLLPRITTSCYYRGNSYRPLQASLIQHTIYDVLCHLTIGCPLASADKSDAAGWVRTNDMISRDRCSGGKVRVLGVGEVRLEQKGHWKDNTTDRLRGRRRGRRNEEKVDVLGSWVMRDR